MGREYVIETADLIHVGWSGCCPDYAFGTVQFVAHASGHAAFNATEAEVARLENLLVGARANRELKRDELNQLNRRAVYGLLNDPDYGDDHPLYAQWGYVRRSDRESGLTRPNQDIPPTGSNA